jgi:hypothetical protein
LEAEGLLGRKGGKKEKPEDQTERGDDGLYSRQARDKLHVPVCPGPQMNTGCNRRRRCPIGEGLLLLS